MSREVFEPGPGKLDNAGSIRVNLRAVLTAIATNPGGSAADVARATGLSGSTAFRLVAELSRRGLVLEGARIRGKRGQPGVSLSMNPEGAYSAGCQIGFGNCYLFVRSLGGRVLAEKEFSIERCSYKHVSCAVAKAYESVLAEIGDDQVKPIGLGIAVPADFDRLCQVVMGVHGAPWSEVAFRKQLERLLDVPISTYSTGSAGAWAELASTPPPRPADYLYLFVDRFIQSGLLLDARLWVPPFGGHGSLGRTIISEAKAKLYDLVGGQAWMEEASNGGISQAEVTERWARKAARALAIAIQGVSDTLDLPLIVLDGTLPPDLMDTLAEHLAVELPPICWASAPQVRRGSAGIHSPAKGAALRPLYTEFFADEHG
ncbi:MAG: ROK family transcriptional regulator [Devosia sp.]|nr:ROK family transcriptional regulator [Devosia sp.]